MAQRVKQPTMNGRSEQFPPEADDEFEMVSQKEIDAWREKLNARFGIGQGQFRSLDLVTVR